MVDLTPVERVAADALRTSIVVDDRQLDRYQIEAAARAVLSALAAPLPASGDPVPLHAQRDLWTALCNEPGDFDAWRAPRTYGTAWSDLLAAVRNCSAGEAVLDERLDAAQHDLAEAEAALERVKAEHWNAFGIRHLAEERARYDEETVTIGDRAYKRRALRDALDETLAELDAVNTVLRENGVASGRGGVRALGNNWAAAKEARNEAEERFERSQADLGEAVATGEKLKAGVARQRETIDAIARIAYDEMWGERFPHRGHDDTSGGPDCAGCWADMILQAIGEEPKDADLAARFAEDEAAIVAKREERAAQFGEKLRNVCDYLDRTAEVPPLLSEPAPVPINVTPATAAPVNIEERPEDTARRFAGELTAIDKTLRETGAATLPGADGVRQLGTRYQEAKAEAERFTRHIKDLGDWLIEHTGEPKGSYGAITAAKNAITELTGERDQARAENHALKVAPDPAPWREEANLDGVGAADLAVMLDEVLRHVTALPSNMRYRSRLTARRSSAKTATPARPIASDRPEHRPAGTVSALEQPLVKRKLPDFLREAGHVTLAGAVQRTQERLAAEAEPSLRDVVAAAYRNGLSIRKDVDEVTEYPDRGEHWHLREWSITNAHGRQVGRLEIETGPTTHVRILSRRDKGAGRHLLTDPTPGDVLAAARAAGLITK